MIKNEYDEMFLMDGEEGTEVEEVDDAEAVDDDAEVDDATDLAGTEEETM